MIPAPPRGWPQGRPRALAFLPRFLFADTGPAWRYILFAWPIVAVPGLALGWLASRLAPGLAAPQIDGGAPLWLVAAGVVVVSLFFETLLMTAPVALIDRRFGRSRRWSAARHCGRWRTASPRHAGGW